MPTRRLPRPAPATQGPKSRPKPRPQPVDDAAEDAGSRFAVSILAGGLGSRMGGKVPKAQLRLGGTTLLRHVQRRSNGLNCPTRVIRRDLLPRCGPLGGIYTSLKTSRAEAEVFLACDMPFVSLAWLQRLQKAWGPAARAVFSASEGRVGFPCILGSDTLTVVSHQIALGEFSLQRLAQVLGARVLTVPRGWRWQLGNINTPDDLADARLTRRVLAKLDFFENPLAGRL